MFSLLLLLQTLRQLRRNCSYSSKTLVKMNMRWSCCWIFTIMKIRWKNRSNKSLSHNCIKFQISNLLSVANINIWRRFRYQDTSPISFPEHSNPQPATISSDSPKQKMSESMWRVCEEPLYSFQNHQDKHVPKHQEQEEGKI